MFCGSTRAAIISSILVAIFTGMLAILGMLQLLAIRQQGKFLEDSTEQQLRAYLAAIPNGTTELFHGDEIYAYVNHRNDGLTPAYITSRGLRILIDDEELSNDNRHVFEALEMDGTELAVPRSGTVEYWGYHPGFSLTQVQSVRNYERKERLYVIGQFYYLDVYGKYRFTRFCFMYYGKDYGPEDAEYCGSGNDAN